MKRQMLFVLSIAALGALAAATSEAADSGIDAGLVPVRSLNLDAFYVRPNADLGGYRKVLIDPARVAFRDDWNKNPNDSLGYTRRIAPYEVEQHHGGHRFQPEQRRRRGVQGAGYEIVAARVRACCACHPERRRPVLNAPDARPAGTASRLPADPAKGRSSSRRATPSAGHS